MAKCRLITKVVVFSDDDTMSIMNSLSDVMDIFDIEHTGIVDRDAFLDALIDGCNFCKVNNSVQIHYLNWLIYETLQSVEGLSTDIYEGMVERSRKTMTYLMKIIADKDETKHAYVSFGGLSSIGELTLILEDPEMNISNKIKKDVAEMFCEMDTRKSVSVSLREHLNILSEIDRRYDHLLDYPQVITDLINQLDQNILSKRDIWDMVKKINLSDYLLREDLVANEYDGDEHHKSNVELLFALAVKLMETAIVTNLYYNGRMHYSPLPVDASGICIFVANPFVGNINVKEIGFF